MSHFKIDDSQLKKFQKLIGKEFPRGFQKVTAEYLNSSAFRARELNIKNLQSQMTIRDQRFLSSALRVEKTKPVSINQQIAISGSITKPRFTGWKEQENGTAPERKRKVTVSARGGSKQAKAQQRARLKPSNKIYKPEQYQGSSYTRRFYFMMRVLGSRGGGQFLITQKISTKRGLLNPALYGLKGGKISMLQKFEAPEIKRKPWQTDDWADIKRRAEINSARALERWKDKERSKGLK
jgi:hypothetical protein